MAKARTSAPVAPADPAPAAAAVDRDGAAAAIATLRAKAGARLAIGPVQPMPGEGFILHCADGAVLAALKTLAEQAGLLVVDG